jgi:hypothetical protein
MNAQITFGILRTSYKPKLSYILRTTPPRLTKQACCEFDQGVANAFRTIHKLPTPDENAPEHVLYAEERSIDLPVTLGGVGLTKSEHVASAGYFSVLQSHRQATES